MTSLHGGGGGGVVERNVTGGRGQIPPFLHDVICGRLIKKKHKLV